MSIPQISNEARGRQILEVFHNEFGDLLARDPDAFNTKFRKMAASPFAFYRGSACLFYSDLGPEQQGSRYLNEKTNRVWIHGDLHAENFGTYMDSRGRLVFNVNDFDEAYIGPFTWDLKRFVTSITLIGHSKALSDGQIARLVRTYATAYHECIHNIARGAKHEVDRFTLDTAEGPVLEALQSARSQTRAELLSSMTEIHNSDRRFNEGGGAVKLDDDTRRKVLHAFEEYLKTLPKSRPGNTTTSHAKDVIGRRGVGIGSAGLPSYNILLQGETDALEDDVVLYMKQAQVPAASRHLDNSAAEKFFENEGHRSVISQRALQVHADPWSGWTEIDGKGQLIAQISAYAVDLDWSDIDDPKEMASIVADLGKATAVMHAAADKDKGQSELVPFSAETEIDAVIGDDFEGFKVMLADFAHDYGARVRQDHQIFVDLFRNGKIPGLPTESDN